MILPVHIIGSSVLRKKAVDIDENYPDLKELIDNMFETMISSDGVGLAAPQVGVSIRLFIIDASPMAEEDPELIDFKRTFINAHITEMSGEKTFEPLFLATALHRLSGGRRRAFRGVRGLDGQLEGNPTSPSQCADLGGVGGSPEGA